MHSHDTGYVSPQSVERGHEFGDIGLRGFIWFVVVFIIVVAAVEVLIVGVLVGMQKRYEASQKPRSPLAEAVDVAPPEPRLQPEPRHDRLPMEDLRLMRQRENDILNNYGAAPQPTITGGDAHVARQDTPNPALAGTPGTAGRISIDRAMQLFVDSQNTSAGGGGAK